MIEPFAYATLGEDRRPAGVYSRLAGRCDASGHAPRDARHPQGVTLRFISRLHRHMSLFVIVAAWAPLFAACGPTNIQPSAAVTGARASDNTTIDWSDWGLTLSRAVVGRQVDYRACLEDRAALDRFLAHVANVGPNTAPAAFPERDDRLAYEINCYNATILRSLLEFATDHSMPGRVPVNLEGRYRYRIDGAWRTPGQLRRAVLDQAGDDWRVQFTLCDGSRGSPPLWNRPFLGDVLDAQLNEVVRAAVASPQIVEIDHGLQRLRLWSGLYGIAGRLVREYEEHYRTEDATILNALLTYSDRARREELNTAVGYDVALLPADNQLNAFEQTTEDRGVLGLSSAN